MFHFSKIVAAALAIISVATAPAPIGGSDSGALDASKYDLAPQSGEIELERRGVSTGLVMSGTRGTAATLVLAMKLVGAPEAFGLPAELMKMVTDNIRNGLPADISSYLAAHYDDLGGEEHTWNWAISGQYGCSVASNVALTAGSATAASATFTYRMILQLGHTVGNNAMRQSMIWALMGFLRSKGVTPRRALLRKRETENAGITLPEATKSGLVVRSSGTCPATNPFPSIYKSVTSDPKDPGDAGSVPFCAPAK